MKYKIATDPSWWGGFPPHEAMRCAHEFKRQLEAKYKDTEFELVDSRDADSEDAKYFIDVSWHTAFMIHKNLGDIAPKGWDKVEGL